MIRTVTIFLDLDDVMVDWAGVACATMGLDLTDPQIRKDIEDQWGGIDKYVSDAELWGKIHAMGMDWWADLPLLPWANRLYTEMSALGRVVFLTAPSDHWTCVAGKHIAMKKHFNTRDYFMGKPKEEAAASHRILIDDRPENCQKFVKAGGQAFEWPSATKLQRLGGWDRITDQAVEFVKGVQSYISLGVYYSGHCIPELVEAE